MISRITIAQHWAGPCTCTISCITVIMQMLWARGQLWLDVMHPCSYGNKMVQTPDLIIWQGLAFLMDHLFAGYNQWLIVRQHRRNTEREGMGREFLLCFMVHVHLFFDCFLSIFVLLSTIYKTVRQTTEMKPMSKSVNKFNYITLFKIIVPCWL